MQLMWPEGNAVKNESATAQLNHKFFIQRKDNEQKTADVKHHLNEHMWNQF